MILNPVFMAILAGTVVATNFLRPRQDSTLSDIQTDGPPTAGLGGGTFTPSSQITLSGDLPASEATTDDFIGTGTASRTGDGFGSTSDSLSPRCTSALKDMVEKVPMPPKELSNASVDYYKDHSATVSPTSNDCGWIEAMSTDLGDEVVGYVSSLWDWVGSDEAVKALGSLMDACPASITNSAEPVACQTEMFQWASSAGIIDDLEDIASEGPSLGTRTGALALLCLVLGFMFGGFWIR